ncbi:uncharacterized protein LOC144761674 [Lissotriton helveticus]
MAEMTLGLLPRTGRLARWRMTPLMARILSVTQPELDGHLRAHQQQVGASTEDTEGHGTDTSGEASGTTATHELTDTDVTSTSEGDRSALEESRPETPTSTSDASGDSLMLAGTESWKSASFSTTHCPVPTLPATSTRAARASTNKKGRVSFRPRTAAPVSPAALSVEALDLLCQLCVGQTTLLNALQDHDKKLAQVVAFMEGIHSDVGGLHRTVQSLSNDVTAAIQLSQAQSPAPVPSATPLPVARSDESDHSLQPTGSRYTTRSTQQQHSKWARVQTPSPTQTKVTQECNGKRPSGDTQGHQAKKQASGSHASKSAPSKDTPVPKTDKQLPCLL